VADGGQHLVLEAFDAAALDGGGEASRRIWAARFAPRLHALGAVWFAAAGAWYIFGAMPEAGRAALTAGPWLPVTALTAAGPAAVWTLLALGARRAARAGTPPGRVAGIAALVAQFAVLALNAVSRQVVQNAELAPHVDVAARPVTTHTGPLVLFLVLFVAGLGVVVWLVRQAMGAARRAPTG